MTYARKLAEIVAEHLAADRLSERVGRQIQPVLPRFRRTGKPGEAPVKVAYAHNADAGSAERGSQRNAASE